MLKKIESLIQSLFGIEDNMEFNRIGPANGLVTIYKILGLWQVERRWQRIYQIYSITIHGIFTVTFILLMYINLGLAFTQSINEISDSLYLTLTETGLMIKFINTFFKSKYIYAFIKSTDDPILELRSEEEFKIFQKSHKYIRWIGTSYIALSIVVALLGILSAVLSAEYKLPFPAWIPFDWKNKQTYWFVFFFEVGGCFITCIMNTSIDVMQSYILLHISLYCKVIAFRLEGLTYNARNEINQNSSSELVGIIKLHQYIRIMTQNAEYLMSVPILGQIVLSAFVLCFSVYQLKDMSIQDDPGLFVLFADYCGVMLMQIYLPCYYGNEVTTESSKLQNAIYNSNWLQAPIKTKKMVYMYMESVRNPIVLKAGNFFVIGLGIFTKVVNNSYSLLALILNAEK